MMSITTGGKIILLNFQFTLLASKAKEHVIRNPLPQKFEPFENKYSPQVTI